MTSFKPHDATAVMPFVNKPRKDGFTLFTVTSVVLVFGVGLKHFCSSVVERAVSSPQILTFFSSLQKAKFHAAELQKHGTVSALPSRDVYVRGRVAVGV